MNIIDEFRRVTEEMAVAESVLNSINRDIRQNINAYKPNQMGGIDYSKDKIQNSNMQLDIFSNYAELQGLWEDRDRAEKDFEEIKAQRDSLEKTINSLGDIEKKVLMRRIKGYSNRQIADELHYSLRGVEDIFKRTRKKTKVCGENVVEGVVI